MLITLTQIDKTNHAKTTSIWKYTYSAVQSRIVSSLISFSSLNKPTIYERGFITDNFFIPSLSAAISENLLVSSVLEHFFQLLITRIECFTD